MKILYLGPNRNKFTKFLIDSGEDIYTCEDKLKLDSKELIDIDYIISYGYRHIINNEIIDKFNGRIINLHISFLPWNRGADPNLWSFLEDTPKGVTIHYMDRGIDTGEIIVQKEVKFEAVGETLQSTYNKLSDEIETLFFHNWENIKRGSIQSIAQAPGGSFHKAKDKERFIHLLRLGWNTPVENLIGKAL